MHIGGVMVFDPPPGGGPPAMAELCADMASRLASLPRYSQHLSAERTGGLAWPHWEDDPHFDIAQPRRSRRAAVSRRRRRADRMVRRTSSPTASTAPARCGRWCSLEGLDGGRWALATKTHHCLVDGVGSVERGPTCCSTLEPEPKRRAASGRLPMPSQPRTARSRLGSHPPDAIADLARTGMLVPPAAARTCALHPRETLERSRAMVELIVRDEVDQRAPHEPQRSHRLDPELRDRPRIDLARAESRSAMLLGGTFNDVVLAACTTGTAERCCCRAARSRPPRGCGRWSR